MNINIAAEALKELGHPTRLSVFKELVKFGYEGLPVGNCKNVWRSPPRHSAIIFPRYCRWGSFARNDRGGSCIASHNMRC